jgi:hypothetical protein
MNFRKIITSGLVAIFLVAIYSFSTKTEIYISKTGNDSSDGTLQHPVKTFARAFEIIKENNTDKSTILIREGVYEISSSITNIPDNITISGYPGEKVVLTGGKKISGFAAIDKNSEVYNRLSKKVREKIVRINLKKLGITDYGELKARGFGRDIQPSGLMLFFNNQPMNIARWPNNSWELINDVPEELEGTGFSYSGNKPNNWKDSNDIWMHGYWKYDWSDNYVKIKNIDKQNKKIIAAEPYSRYPFTKGRRYYYFNILEELDSPGEWHLDRSSGMLYFYPPAKTEDADIYVSLISEPLIKLENKKNVLIQNITFEYSRGTGVQIIGGSNNLLKNCTLCNLGTVGVNFGNSSNPSSNIYKNTLFNGNSGNNNGISGCEIYNIGEVGVLLGGGDRKTLKPGKNFVENSKIYKVSQWVRTYRAAIFMFGVGNIARHNEIFDLPHTAIFFWGNEHIIEYNNIYHVCTETTDAGALYNGRDWSQRGTIIRFNYIHQLSAIKTTGSYPEVMGIYLDDFCSGITVYGNIFYKAGRSVMIGGGRDNKVKNNIFIDGHPAVHVDARGIGWAKYYFKNTPEKKKNNTLLKRLEAVNYKNTPYSEKYPELLTVLTDEPEMPKHNCIEGNVFCDGKWREILNNINVSVVCFKNNKVLKDCKFYKITDNNISIDFDNNIFDNYFKQISVSEIGIQK